MQLNAITPPDHHANDIMNHSGGNLAFAAWFDRTDLDSAKDAP